METLQQKAHEYATHNPGTMAAGYDESEERAFIAGAEYITDILTRKAYRILGTYQITSFDLFKALMTSDINLDEPTTKVCCCCKKEMPLTQFYKDAGRRDGLDMYCKACRKEKHITYQLRKEL